MTRPQTSLVMRLASKVEAWFFEPIDGRTLVLVRVGLGVTLAWAYLRYLPHVQTLFGPAGIAGHDALAAHPMFAGLSYDRFAKFRLLHHVESAAVVWFLWGGVIASALAFAAGYRTRAAGIIAVGLHLAFTAHNPHASSGWAWMIGPYILYVVAARPTLGGRMVPWGARLLQVHVAAMYLTAGWERLDHESWVRGEMLLWAMADGLYGRLDFDFLAWAPLLAVINYGVYVLEPAAAFLLFVPRVGPVCALLLIAMHAGIELSAEVGFWQPMMISGLVVFLPPAWFPWLDRGGASARVLAPASPPRYDDEIDAAPSPRPDEP